MPVTTTRRSTRGFYLQDSSLRAAPKEALKQLWRSVLLEPATQDSEYSQRKVADQSIAVERSRRFEMHVVDGRGGGGREQARMRRIHEPVPLGAHDQLGHRQLGHGLGDFRFLSEHPASRKARRP